MSVYDLALFEQLNDEYRSAPVKPTPVPRDRQSFQEKATKRIATIGKQLDRSFDGATVLEVGCGHGWLTAFLPERANVARAIGVDVRRYPTWAEHSDPRVELLEADLSASSPIPAGSVDYVISGAVLEHVERPLEMLMSIHDVLAEGGRAWLYFNLYTGPVASHRYNEVSFPWPHLLFEDSVCMEFYARHHGREDVRFAWVNHMTLAHYIEACHEIGFQVLDVLRRATPIDIAFYVRFEEKLGRYAALDLETDFATLILEKAAAPTTPTPLGYLERQREFAQELARHTRTDSSPTSEA